MINSLTTKFIKVFTIIVVIMWSGNAFSQVDRRISQNHSQSEPVREEKIDHIALTVDRLTEDLTLDSFQQAVIRDILEVGQKEQIKIFEENIPSGSKTEKLVQLQRKSVEQIKGILNPQQVEIYDKLVNKKKKKK